MPTTPNIPAAASGHRELTLAERAILDEIDALSVQLLGLALSLETRSDINKRYLAIARTKLETGVHWLKSSVAPPSWR